MLKTLQHLQLQFEKEHTVVEPNHSETEDENILELARRLDERDKLYRKAFGVAYLTKAAEEEVIRASITMDSCYVSEKAHSFIIKHAPIKDAMDILVKRKNEG